MPGAATLASASPRDAIVGAAQGPPARPGGIPPFDVSQDFREWPGRVTVREAEGTTWPAECFEVATSRCAIARVCKLRGVLEEAMQAFYGVLEQYTLQDLVRDRAPLARILFVPPKPRARR